MIRKFLISIKFINKFGLEDRAYIGEYSHKTNGPPKEFIENIIHELNVEGIIYPGMERM